MRDEGIELRGESGERPLRVRVDCHLDSVKHRLEANTVQDFDSKRNEIVCANQMSTKFAGIK